MATARPFAINLGAPINETTQLQILLKPLMLPG